MLAAMTGFSTAYFSGSLWLGVAAALTTGMLAGLLMGLLTVSLGLSQHVSGIGVTLLCSGLSFYFYRLIFGQPSTIPKITAFSTTSPWSTWPSRWCPWRPGSCAPHPGG